MSGGCKRHSAFPEKALLLGSPSAHRVVCTSSMRHPGKPCIAEFSPPPLSPNLGSFSVFPLVLLLLAPREEASGLQSELSTLNIYATNTASYRKTLVPYSAERIFFPVSDSTSFRKEEEKDKRGKGTWDWRKSCLVTHNFLLKFIPRLPHHSEESVSFHQILKGV